MLHHKYRRVIGPLATLLGLTAIVMGAVLLAYSPASAAPNNGTIWLNNVPSTADPGHDPHLSGDTDINMIASYVGAGAGTFEIVALKPTGDGKAVVYEGNWSYTPGTDPQIIAVIDVGKLMTSSAAKGFTAPHPNQGYHFKIYCFGVPGKHAKTKVFWVTAPAVPQPSPSPSPEATPTPTPSASPAAGVLGANVTGQGIQLAMTGGPLLVGGILLMLFGVITWAGVAVTRRRSSSA